MTKPMYTQNSTTDSFHRATFTTVSCSRFIHDTAVAQSAFNYQQQKWFPVPSPAGHPGEPVCMTTVTQITQDTITPFLSETGWRVCGTPANFNGFRFLAALLHGTQWASAKLCGIQQRRHLYFTFYVVSVDVVVTCNASFCCRSR